MARLSKGMVASLQSGFVRPRRRRRMGLETLSPPSGLWDVSCGLPGDRVVKA